MDLGLSLMLRRWFSVVMDHVWGGEHNITEPKRDEARPCRQEGVSVLNRISLTSPRIAAVQAESSPR
jgi:hypothetical protein